MEQKFVFLEPKDIGTDKDPLHVLWKKLQKQKEYRKANTIAKRLQRRLVAMGEDVEEPKRLYCGHYQRSAGAWSWSAQYKGMAQEQPQNTEFHFVTENLAYVLYDEAKPQVLG